MLLGVGPAGISPDAPTSRAHHRPRCDACRISDRTSGGRDADAGVSGTLISQWGGGPKSSERINIGIIVDVQKRTVIGLESTVPLTIDQITETEISFLGSAGSAWSMSGTLDKITGSLVASSARFALAMDLSSNAGSRVTSCTKTR
jgi:hypothetical protein